MKTGRLFAAARLLVIVAVTAGGQVCLAQSASPSAYPSKPIRFVTGFSPGSSIDAVARILATHVTTRTGQPVVVDTRTGANGMVAATEVARASPDGHTVLISNSSTITVNPLLYKKMTYSPQDDLAPVCLTVAVPFILTVNPDKPPTGTVANVGELMALARSKPGEYTYGSAGLGNLTQLSFELLNSMAGVKMTHVAYRGTAPAQVALMSKEIDASFDNPAAMPQIKAGKVRALAVTSAQRWRDLPDVPTLAEAGYPGYDISFWVGAFVPSQTPPAAVKALHEIIQSAAQDPAVKALLQAQGNLLMLDPQQFATRIRNETQQYSDIIRQADIKLE